jgi:hypothetical protein
MKFTVESTKSIWLWFLFCCLQLVASTTCVVSCLDYLATSHACAIYLRVNVNRKG